MLLYHENLNTGYSHSTNICPINREILDNLLPMIDSDRGIFPETSIEFDILRPFERLKRMNGAACINFAEPNLLTTSPYAICVCCWQEHMSEGAWHLAKTAYLSHQKQLKDAGMWKSISLNMPSVPWIVIMRTAFLPHPSQEILLKLDDMADAVFWALSE